MSQFFYEHKPEHPDYERLNKIRKDTDRALEEGRTISEIVSPFVDLYSIQYVAEQRAALVCASLGLSPRMRPFLSSTFITSFVAGVLWERENHREREWERTDDRLR